MIYMTEFKESEGWEEIMASDAERWCPEKPGDELVGLYVDKKEDVGKNHANAYFITNIIQGEEKEWIVFGTEDLNRKFEHIPIGYEVGIVFQGSKPSKPPKKPFKIFKVYKRPAPGTQPIVERVTEDKPQMFASEEEMKTWQLIEEIAADITVGPVDNKSILMRANRWAREERLDPKDFERIKAALDKNPFKNEGR